MVKFNELGEISNNIRNIKVNIQNKNEIFLRVKNDKFRPDPANEQFFRDLNNYVQLFRTKERLIEEQKKEHTRDSQDNIIKKCKIEYKHK